MSKDISSSFTQDAITIRSSSSTTSTVSQIASSWSSCAQIFLSCAALLFRSRSSTNGETSLLMLCRLSCEESIRLYEDWSRLQYKIQSRYIPLGLSLLYCLGSCIYQLLLLRLLILMTAAVGYLGIVSLPGRSCCDCLHLCLHYYPISSTSFGMGFGGDVPGRTIGVRS